MPKNRLFLLSTAFIAGACIMSLELSASRILAPGYGSSIYVWGALIGVIMIALSLGYYIGGRLADECSDMKLLFKLMIYSSVWVSAVSILGVPLVIFFSIYLGLVFGPLLSTLLLFAAPMTVLSMASPMAVRFYNKRMSTVGSSAGLVYAVSTFGSIVGTFATAFILIPHLGTRATLLANVLVLFAVSALALSERVHTLMVIFLIPGFIFSPMQMDELIYRTESEYNIISVYDSAGSRKLILNWEWVMQTYMDKESLLTGSMYYDSYTVAPLLNDAETVLWLGMGGGTSVKQLLHFHDVEIDAVELDPKVVYAAKRYFDVAESDRLRIYTMDGRWFLRRSGRYDIINIDVFKSGDIPFHMATREFFTECSDHMSDDGLLMMNTITPWGDARVSDSLAHTLKQVFPSVYYMGLGKNKMLIAFKKEKNRAELVDALRGNMDPRLNNIVVNITEGLSEYNRGHGVVFTDDRSNIEELAFMGRAGRSGII